MIAEKDSKCCGCTACEKCCPVNAISMVKNQKGFVTPCIDVNSCINCGICARVCPLNGDGVKPNEFKQRYIAAKLKDEALKAKSQSGGAFGAFARAIIAASGVVYGVALNADFKAVYTRVTKLENLQQLLGSKYIQAEVENVFPEVKEDLLSGKTVLFSGTPCHIHGLLTYLSQKRVDTKNLITVDLICHGVPSPMIYLEYLNLSLNAHKGKKINNFNFRDKSIGWRGHIATITIDGRKYSSKGFVDYFYSHLALRDSCYECQYTSLNRVGDLSIGDCWGIEKVNEDFDAHKGSSLIIVNSTKGDELWAQVEEEFYTLNCEKEQILQPNLQAPTEKPELTEQFWQDYHKYGCEYALTRYCKFAPENDRVIDLGGGLVRRVLRKIRRILGKIYRKLFKA